MILVTGGAGYIGSHALIELIKNNYDIVVIDNLENSNIEAIKRVKKLTGTDFPFYQIDLLDVKSLNLIFSKNKISSVIHFAALKSVGESVLYPDLYYHNNITGTLNLIRTMNNFDVKKLVFSSSATVYGNSGDKPITEDAPRSTNSPYGRTKLMIEDILNDIYESDPTWRINILRYFNPIGAHESGEIGEDPKETPNNIMPYLTQVAVGKRKKLNVFGKDCPTPDGTGIRDYIHVVDLVKGHIKSLEHLENNEGLEVFNLGTGTGYSVLELISNFEKASQRKITYQFVKRRKGDISISYANIEKANMKLGWKAEKGLFDMCKDSWRWQLKNPDGYKGFRDSGL